MSKWDFFADQTEQIEEVVITAKEIISADNYFHGGSTKKIEEVFIT